MLEAEAGMRPLSFSAGTSAVAVKAQRLREHKRSNSHVILGELWQNWRKNDSCDATAIDH